LRGVAASAVVQKQLGLDRLRSQTAIDKSIEGVAGEFRQLAAQDGGAEQLYDAVARTDATIAERFLHERERESALLDASTQLQVIVGSRARERLVDRLVSQTGVTYPQANDSLAFASNSIIDALSEGLVSGAVSDDAAGTAALLSRPASEPIFASRSYASASGTAASGSTSAGAAAVADSDKSWVVRYALPLVLLAAFLLSTLKFCSEAEKNRIVAEERSLLQTELAGAQQQTRTTNSKLSALQADYDSAQKDMAALANNLQASESELAALRDVPTDTVELQKLLRSASLERDRAVELKTQADSQLQQMTAERDQTLEQQQTLQADLDAAVATITANEAAISELEARIDGLITEREGTVVKLTEATDALTNEKAQHAEEVARLNDNADALQRSLDQSQSVQSEQKERIASLTDEIARLQAEVADAGAKLDSERSERTTDTERLSLQASNLQNELKQSVGLYKSAEQKLQEQEAELTTRAARTAELKQQIQELQQQIQQLEQQIQGQQQQIQDREQQIQDQEQQLQEQEQRAATATAEAAETAAQLELKITQLESGYAAAQQALGNKDESLAGNEQALAEINTRLTAARDEVQSLTEVNDGLRKEIDSLSTDNTERVAEIARSDEQYTTLLARLEDTESSLNEAQALKAELENTLRDTSEQLEQVTADEQNTQGDLERANASVEELKTQISNLENELSALAEQADKMTSDLATATRENGSLQSAIEELEQQSKDQQQQFDRRRNQSLQQIAGLEQSLSESEKQMGQFGDELDFLQTQLDQLNALEREPIERAQTLREEISQALAEAGVDNVEVTTTDGDTAVALRLGSNSVFQTGDVALSRGGSAVLNKIGTVIGEYPDWQLDVEGHTDSLPIGEKLRARYPSNWELSSARASAVINYLLLTGKVQPDAISARGFAETRPIADNKDFNGRVANRRVDLILRPR